MYDMFKKIIDAKGISVAEVSRSTGIPKSTLSDWKTGRCNLKVDKLIKIAEYLGVSLEYLTTGNNPPEFVMPEYDERTHELIEKFGALDTIQKEIVLSLTSQLAEKNYIIENYVGTGKKYNGLISDVLNNKTIKNSENKTFHGEIYKK